MSYGRSQPPEHPAAAYYPAPAYALRRPRT